MRTHTCVAHTHIRHFLIHTPCHPFLVLSLFSVCECVYGCVYVRVTFLPLFDTPSFGKDSIENAQQGRGRGAGPVERQHQGIEGDALQGLEGPTSVVENGHVSLHDCNPILI